MVIKPFRDFLQEKIELSKYREIYNKISNEYKQRYEDWFDGKMRIYLPLSGAVTDPVYQEINNAISKNDYEILNWKDGIAKSKKSKRVHRIGRILSSMKEDQLLKKFNERHKGREVSSEDEEDLLVAISRHPYDIAGMSYDREQKGYQNERTKEWLSDKDLRQKFNLDDDSLISTQGVRLDGDVWRERNKGWTSCKHLDHGSNARYIPTEIDAGALIAYVIRADDKNIKKPLSRLLIVPLYNENDPDDTILYVGDKFYGKSISSFKSVVEDWLEEHQGEHDISEYCLDSDKIYNDDYNELRTIGVETLRRELEANGWEIRSLDTGYCEAVTNDLDVLDSIFMSYKQNKQTPSRVSNLFDKFQLQYDLSNVEGDSYSYNNTLQHLLKNETSDENKRKITKLYKDAGGKNDEWDEIVEELDDYLDDLCQELTTWYAQEDLKLYYEEARSLFQKAIFKTNLFFIEQKEDRFYVVVKANAVEWEDLVRVIGDIDFAHDIYDFSVENILNDVYDNLESVEGVDDFLDEILD